MAACPLPAAPLPPPFSYDPLFPFFSDLAASAFKVVADGYVTDDSGTGVVHCAPAFGEDDYRVCLLAGIIQKVSRWTDWQTGYQAARRHSTFTTVMFRHSASISSRSMLKDHFGCSSSIVVLLGSHASVYISQLPPFTLVLTAPAH